MLAFRAADSPEQEAVSAAAAFSIQAYLHLAHGVYQLGRTEEAHGLLERAFAVAQESGAGDPRCARLFNELGVIEARRGNYGAAERHLKRGIAILERTFPMPEEALPMALSNLGAVYRRMDRPGAARLALERALTLAEPKQGEPGLPAAWALDQLGDLEAAENNIPAAVCLLHRALAIKERVLGPVDWDVAVTLDRLGALYATQARYNEAETLLLRVVAIRGQSRDWEGPALARPLARLALIYTRQQKTIRAEHLVRYALKLFTVVLPPSHQEIQGCLNLLAEIYRSLGRFADGDAVSKLANGLANGTRDGSELKRLVSSKPPRIAGPGA
ncbi:MAG TPA: tetratricopeptide repeat protein [Bryobacteraceae bacterium]|nr:tetratricopeptide repeat protein [Bryobacteraceae bacterium]